MRLYEGFEQGSSNLLHQAIRENLLSFLLVGFAVLSMNVRCLRRERSTPNLRLMVFLADMGIVYLLLRDHVFPQTFLPLVLFGSILAGILMTEWIQRVRLGLGERTSLWIAFGMLLVALISLLSFFTSTFFPLEYRETVSR